MAIQNLGLFSTSPPPLKESAWRLRVWLSLWHWWSSSQKECVFVEVCHPRWSSSQKECVFVEAPQPRWSSSQKECVFVEVHHPRWRSSQKECVFVEVRHPRWSSSQKECVFVEVKFITEGVCVCRGAPSEVKFITEGVCVCRGAPAEVNVAESMSGIEALEGFVIGLYSEVFHVLVTLINKWDAYATFDSADIVFVHEFSCVLIHRLTSDTVAPNASLAIKLLITKWHIYILVLGSWLGFWLEFGFRIMIVTRFVFIAAL